MVRSFAEHRPAQTAHERTAVIESGLFWSLLFLNNNLHALHHARPSAPWYDLPAEYRARKNAVLAQNGGYMFKGYGEIFRRSLFSAPAHPVHPGGG